MHSVLPRKLCQRLFPLYRFQGYPCLECPIMSPSFPHPAAPPLFLDSLTATLSRCPVFGDITLHTPFFIFLSLFMLCAKSNIVPNPIVKNPSPSTSQVEFNPHPKNISAWFQSRNIKRVTRASRG